MSGIREHPQRIALTNELHARPFAELAPPEEASHFAFLSGDGGAQAARAHLAAICDRFGVAHPPMGATHFNVDLGPLRLKWEQHTEFVSYTLFRHGPFDAPFAQPPSTYMPENWLADAPGQLLVAVQVAVDERARPERSADELTRLFVRESLSSSFVSDGAARIWTDFRIHGDGCSHILLQDIRLTPRQAGRVVQRMLEIETYRTMALLALPAAREAGPRITRIDRALADLTARLNESRLFEDEQRLLQQLTTLSAEIEGLSAATAYRFSAAGAYYALVRSRIAELREQRVEGSQTVQDFMARRLAPAMRTCESVAARQEVLSTRISRAANMLRTRVDMALEGQNRDLLASMDRRAKLQLRLQQTVEGLSVAAITYYLVSLLGYVFKAANAAGLPLDADIARAAAIPIVAVLVWLGVRRVRRAVTGGEHGE
ncbi:MAG: DUF3422 domain-containing protein [Alphaproteobacteria bacterium]|nr:DUF3422 domain-containing protein [Alphaproteobacteria bacterium]